MEKVYSVGDKVRLIGYPGTVLIIKIENFYCVLIEYSNESRTWVSQSQLSPVIDLINREELIKKIESHFKICICETNKSCYTCYQGFLEVIKKMESTPQNA